MTQPEHYADEDSENTLFNPKTEGKTFGSEGDGITDTEDPDNLGTTHEGESKFTP